MGVKESKGRIVVTTGQWNKDRMLMFSLILIINVRIISLLVLFSNTVLVNFRSPLSNISFAHKTC